MNDALLELLIPLLLAALTAATGWLAPRLRTVLTRQADRVQNDTLRLALQMASQAATTAVVQVSQTAVAELKAARADGKLTADEARAALRTAVHRAWLSLGASAKDALLAEFGSEDAIKRQVLVPEIETKVATLRDVLPAKSASTDPGTVAREVAIARQRIGLQP